MISDIYNAGGADYFKDKGVYRNPHASGTEEFNSYERGWVQALKRDEGKSVRYSSTPSDFKYTLVKPSTPVNLYALEKGRDAPRKPK